MTIANALASMAVNNIEAAEKWYGNILGRRADAALMPGLVEWTFPSGGQLQIYALPERAGSCSCTLAVSHIDIEAAGLEKLGVATGARMGEHVKVFMVRDPDGNSIAFSQSPGDSTMIDTVAIARAAYDAYVSKDRATIEALIADDFHFSSPLDNRWLNAAVSSAGVTRSMIGIVTDRFGTP